MTVYSDRVLFNRQFTTTQRLRLTAVSPLLAGIVSINQADEWWARHLPEKRILKGRAYLVVKRAIDLAIVGALLPIIIPVLLICSLLIKIESPHEPVLFKQKRNGKDGRSFYIVKFRTMVPDAAERQQELLHLNELEWPDFKITNDPRVTRIGKLLRKTSLDELPQLLNVLRGDMSLVGPRPTYFDIDQWALWHTEVLDVPQGITGLYQITGRGWMKIDDRARLDIAYVEHCCLWLDIQILFRTLIAVIQQRGAV